MKTKIIFIAAVLLSISLGGCDLLRKKVEKQEETSYKLSSVSVKKIVVDNTNGDIEIIRSNDSTGITVKAIKEGKVKYTERDKPLENISVIVDSSNGVVSFKTEIKKSMGIFKKSDGGSVEYEVRVPKNVEVEISTTNGDISMLNVPNTAKLNTINGEILFANAYGVYEATSVNGSIVGNIDSTKGIYLKTTNGSIKLGNMKNVSCEVNVSNVNGSIKYKDIEFKNLSSSKHSLSGILNNGGAKMDVSSTNGSIRFQPAPFKVDRQRHDDFEFKFDFDDDEEKIIDTRVPRIGEDGHEIIEEIKSKDNARQKDGQAPGSDSSKK